MQHNLDLIRDAFSRNRAEEFGLDVWKRFVLPPFFDQLDLQTAKKPRLIIGGRGCGKTMLLRYLSHHSMFSPERKDVPNEAISQVGLYWRTDTQFCNAMTKRGIEDDVWQTAFSHYMAITLSQEILNSLRTISKSALGIVTEEDISALRFSALRAFDQNLPDHFDELSEHLVTRLWAFESWVSNVRKEKSPHFLPGIQFVKALISLVAKQNPALSTYRCYAYIDEYENLCSYQQRLINTWLKHSEGTLIFHVAMKRHAFNDPATSGIESISGIHDFRVIDLEEHLLSGDFEAFASEILLLYLQESHIKIPLDINILRNIKDLRRRRERPYVEEIKGFARSIFPQTSSADLATMVFSDLSLRALLKERISRALAARGSKINPDSFLRDDFREASIVVPALLHRERLTPQEIILELNKLQRGEENKFSGKTNWIHNNFIGCLLQLYAPYMRACPFYAGFTTFCQLSRGNLRHFLELCYKSLHRLLSQNQALPLRVDVITQAEAARQASASLLREVRGFGSRGEQLHTFVLRLGTLFSTAHQRPSQSEPEQNHFSISSGSEHLSADDWQLLREALKWSVLFEETSTKEKDATKADSVDYVLNPIYAPYFYISYRKRRKLSLSTGDFIDLIRGNVDKFTTLIRKLTKRWTIADSDNPPTALPLFSD